MQPKINIEAGMARIPKVIPRDKIALPTSGAVVCAIERATAGAGEAAFEYVRVSGAINPVDPAAPDIRFEVDLPILWNGKTLHIGGGGMDGVIPDLSGPTRCQREEDLPPLGQGYATFGSDSGHVAASAEASMWDCSFALNDEALRNFGGDQLKKTRDASLEIVRAFYGDEPRYAYFAGGSNGGREALKAAQCFAQDYDGILCRCPAHNWTAKALLEYRNMQAILADGGAGWIGPKDYRRVAETVLDICDDLDGIRDGIVADLREAAQKEAEVIDALRGFLTVRQVETLRQIASPLQIDFPLKNGVTCMPGYPVFRGAPLVDCYMNYFGTAPGAKDGSMMGMVAESFRYMIARDPAFDLANFDPLEWRERIEELSELMDATSLDLRAFKERGAKLLMLHGTADQIVPVDGTIGYYHALELAFGREGLDEFVRFYLIPGYGHGIGEGFTMGADMLGALDLWVTVGKAPDSIIATDKTDKTRGRTRPVFPYPDFAVYIGGDPNCAESFDRSNG